MSPKEYNNIEDFLIDNTFQQYCSGEDDQCTALWERYIASHPQKQETIAQAKRLFHILAGHKKPIDQQVEHIKEILSKNTTPKRYTIFRLSNLLKVAAVLLVFGISYMWFVRPKEVHVAESDILTVATYYETKKGERKDIELPDGTRVSLNSASRLEIGSAFNERDRHVHLMGEAYFEVEHDKERPFVLHTSDFDIRVLGTSFNVKSYPDELSSEALLVEGVIEMRSKDKNENSIIVKPNQKVTIYKDNKPRFDEVGLEKRQIAKVSVKEIAIQDVENIVDAESTADIAWKENRLEVVDQDFVSLKKVLERWYDVDIDLQGDCIGDFRFTATFSKENIEQVLNALQKVQPFKYEMYGKKITIYEK